MATELDMRHFKRGLFEVILKRAIDESSRVLSKTFRAGAKIEFVKMKKADLADLSSNMSNLEGEYIGSFVELTGSLPLQLLFLVDRQTALLFSDLFMKYEAGTTVNVDDIVKSVQQELGNVLGSAVSNIFHADLGIDSMPKPPKVLYDFAASIFSTYLMSEASKIKGHVYIIETLFTIVRFKMNAKLFLLPNSDSLSKYDLNWE